MLTDVSRLRTGDQQEFDFEKDMTVGDRPAKVHAHGSILCKDKDYILNGSINAVVDMKCDLCLKTFKKEFDIPFSEIYSNSETPESEEKEYRAYDDRTLDIKPAVEENILLEMPMKALCSPDCKGLCSVCGHDLNKGECGCDRNAKGSVFDSLMSLFEDEDN